MFFKHIHAQVDNRDWGIILIPKFKARCIPLDSGLIDKYRSYVVQPPFISNREAASICLLSLRFELAHSSIGLLTLPKCENPFDILHSLLSNPSICVEICVWLDLSADPVVEVILQIQGHIVLEPSFTCLTGSEQNVIPEDAIFKSFCSKHNAWICFGLWMHIAI